MLRSARRPIHPELVEEEREDVGSLGEASGDGGARAVPGVGVAPDKDGMPGGGGDLEARGHFAGFGRVRAAIGFASEEESDGREFEPL